MLKAAPAEVEVGECARRMERRDVCAAASGGEVERSRVAACEEGCFERVAGNRTAPPRF